MGGHKKNVEEPLLFEIASEVANKVGGIYTVLKTKAPVTCGEYGGRYTLIGPLSYAKAPLEVEATTPTDPEVRAAVRALNDGGVKTLYGRWLIDGAPNVLLVDIGSIAWRLNEWKADLWNVAGIPSPAEDTETNDVILLGYITAWFFGELAARLQAAKRRDAVIAHFHEWNASVGLILIRKRNLDVATVFTTHATLLGRYLCAGDVDFYNNLAHFDVDYEAGRRQIYHRYCIERGAAHSADVFTTVSHITAYESEHLLKRKPDGVVPNGLQVTKFSALHEFQNLHAHNKEKINGFVRGHFYGHNDFDTENTVYFFTAGRYEYRNKGVDMFIEALARLNHRLQHFNSPMTVVAFIIMPAATHSFAVEALKGQAVIKQLNDTVAELKERIGARLFDAASRGHLPSAEGLLTETDLVPLKRRIFSLKRDSLPPIVTHNMADDAHDPILNQLRSVQLVNRREDRVKVVFHPEFLSSNNPLLGMDYEDFVRGCHLGVFPSYYEPWGYTPAECTVMGVPSISTNLSGFGCYMEEMIESPSDYGIYIVDRRMRSVEESLNQLVDHMMSFCMKSRRQRINQRNRTERLSDILDWKRMGQEYVKARHLALRRKYPSAFKSVATDSEITEGMSTESLDATASSQPAAPAAPRRSAFKKVDRPMSAVNSPRMKADGLLVERIAPASLETSTTEAEESHELRQVRDAMSRLDSSLQNSSSSLKTVSRDSKSDGPGASVRV